MNKRKTFVYKRNNHNEGKETGPSIENINTDQLKKHFYAFNEDNVLHYVSVNFFIDTIWHYRPFISVQWILEIQFPFEAGDKKI